MAGEKDRGLGGLAGPSAKTRSKGKTSKKSVAKVGQVTKEKILDVGPALRSVPTIPEKRKDVGPALRSVPTIPEKRKDVGPALRPAPTVPEKRGDVGPALPSAPTAPQPRAEEPMDPGPTEKPTESEGAIGPFGSTGSEAQPRPESRLVSTGQPDRGATGSDGEQDSTEPARVSEAGEAPLAWSWPTQEVLNSLNEDPEQNEEYYDDPFYQDQEYQEFGEEEGYYGPEVSSPKRYRKKGKRKKHKRRYSSSSSSDSSSSEGEPRKRRKKSSRKDLLGEIKSLVAEQIRSALQPGPTPGPPVVGDLPGTLPSAAAPPPPRVSTTQGTEGRQSSDEEIMLKGTNIPQEAFDAAVETVRRVLGFEAPAPLPKTGRVSRLSLNEEEKPERQEMPVDVECLDRYEKLASNKKWTAFQSKPYRTFRVDEKDWKEIFVTPRLPETAGEKLKQAGVLDKNNQFKSQSLQLLNTALRDVDAASRVGLKFASSMMLFAEVLSRAFQEADDLGVSREDTCSIVAILGPISRLLFDQFTRVSVRATKERRKMVLDAVHWPSPEVKKRFADLPLLGDDLFGGKFDEHLKEEAERRDTYKKADLYLTSTSQQDSRSTGRRSTSGRGPRNRGSRATTSYRGRGRGYQAPFPTTSRPSRRGRRGAWRGRRQTRP